MQRPILTRYTFSGRDDFNRDYNYNNGGFSKNDNTTEHEEGEDDEEYGSNDEEETDANVTPDWTRNFSKFSQPTSLRRIPSHAVNEEDEEYEEDFDHLADAEELERRAALRKASYKIMTTEEEEEEEDDFGDFESAAGSEDPKSNDWDVLSNNMEALNVNKSPEDDNNLVRAIKTKEEGEFLKEKKDYIDEEQEGEV